jgi:hypothetical protein
MYRRTAVTLILLGIFLNVSISELAAAKPKKGPSWICAAQYQLRYTAQVASINVQTYREKFLVEGRQPVRRAMFVFPTFYKVMRQHIRSVVSKRYGIKTIAEKETTTFDEIFLSRAAAGIVAVRSRGKKDLAKLQAGKKNKKLKDIGLKFEGIAETLITTGDYNTVPSKEGWSTLSIRVLNGQQILGTDSTIVIVSRRDNNKEPGMLPFTKNLITGNFVTGTEFSLMERLGRLYRVPFTMAALGGTKPLYAYPDAWKDAKAWLKGYWEKSKQAGSGERAVSAKHPGRC